MGREGAMLGVNEGVESSSEALFFFISKARYINEEAESYKYTGGIQSNNPLSKQKNQQGSPPLSWMPTIPRTL